MNASQEDVTTVPLVLKPDYTLEFSEELFVQNIDCFTLELALVGQQ